MNSQYTDPPERHSRAVPTWAARAIAPECWLPRVITLALEACEDAIAHGDDPPEMWVIELVRELQAGRAGVVVVPDAAAAAHSALLRAQERMEQWPPAA